MSASATASLTNRESKTAKTRNPCSEGQRTNLSPRINSPLGQISFLQRTVGNREVERLLRSRLFRPELTIENSGEKSGSPHADASSRRASEHGILQRQCACGGAVGISGECEECSKKRRLGLQTKLKVNEPGDIYEQEADRVANKVMATSARHSVGGAPPHIQRVTGQPADKTATAAASVDQALASPGKPLETRLRQEMEQRFACDFANVRIHSGAAAGQSARDVNANAYTVGHAIVFGESQFAPGTSQGRRLIAHELTHVVQQSGAARIHGGQSNQTRHPSLSANYSIARQPRTGAPSALKRMDRNEARAVLAAYIAKGGVDDTFAAMNAIEETLDSPSTSENWRSRLRLLTAAFSLLDNESAAIVLKALTTPVGARQEHLRKRFLRLDSDSRDPLLEILRERAATRTVTEAKPPETPSATAPPSAATPKWIELYPGVFALVPDAGTTLDAVAAYVSDNPAVPPALARLNKLSRTTPIEAGQSIIVPVQFIQRPKALQEMSEPMRRYILSTQEARPENAAHQRFIQVRRPNLPGPGIGGSLVLAGKVAVRPIELTAAAIGRIVDALIGLIEKAGYAIAFGAGVVHGFFKAIWDAVSGIAKLIYEVLKSIFSLDLVSDLEKIIGALKKLTIEQIKQMLGEWAAGWAEKLHSANPLIAGHAHGYLTGYVMAEAAMLLLTGGAATGAKAAIWGSKLGSAVKASRAFKVLETSIEQVSKVRRAAGGQFDNAVDALRKSRLGTAVKAAEVTGAAVAWTAGKVMTALKLPGDIAVYIVDKAVVHSRKLGKFFDRIGALRDGAKRWLFGCRLRCDWEADAVAATMSNLTNKQIEEAAERAAAVTAKSSVAKPRPEPATIPRPAAAAPLDLTNVASGSAEVRKASVAKSSLLDEPGPQQLRHEIDEVLAHPQLIKREGARVHRPLGNHDWEHHGGGIWCRRSKETCVIIRRTQPGPSSEEISGVPMESPQGQAIKEKWLAESRAVESFPRERLNDPVPHAERVKSLEGRPRRTLTPEEKKGAKEILDAFDDYARGDQKAIDRLTSQRPPRRRKKLTKEPYIGWEEIDLLPNNPGYANEMRLVFRIVKEPSAIPSAIGGKIEVQLLQMH